MRQGGAGAILRSSSISLEMGASLSSSGSSAMLDKEAAKSDGGLTRVVSVQRMRAAKPYQKLFRQAGVRWWLLGFVVLVCVLWGVAFGVPRDYSRSHRAIAAGGVERSGGDGGGGVLGRAMDTDKVALDMLAELFQFAAGGSFAAPTEGEVGRGVSEGLTPVPSVAMCEDGDKNSQSALEDFSRWKPEGHWPSRGPKQRIALFAGVYNHVVDGVALTCNRLVAYLVSQGHEVIVMAPTSDEPKLKHAGELFPIASVSAPGRPEYRIALGLTSAARGLLGTFNPTLVHIATPDVLGFQAQAWAREMRVPVVCSYHTHFAQYLSYYHLGALEGTIWRVMSHFYSGCIHTYVPTASVKAELEAHDVVTDGVRIWTRGVDTRLFNPSKRCPEWRTALGVEPDVPIVLLVCRLVWEKALDIYAEVIMRLEDKGIPHRAVVVGEGPARLGMRALIPNALFLGSLSGPELARAYSSSDVFLFPSHTETFGITTLEAMSSGLAVVVADKNESNDTAIVDDGTTGFLAPIGDRAAFLDFTERLAKDDSLRKSMGEAGRRRAEDHFQWGRAFTELVDHYNDAIAYAEAHPLIPLPKPLTPPRPARLLQ